MENTKKVDIAKGIETEERVKKDWGGSSCPFWWFGDDDSAKNDLDKAFEITDDEKD